MSNWSQVHSPDVVTAIEEHDRLGSRDFLGRYGIRKSREATLWHRGNEYDPQAILGAAYEHATGQTATWDDSDGEAATAAVLTGLGFDVVVEEPPVVTPRRRAPAAKQAVAPDETGAEQTTVTKAVAKKAAVKKVAAKRAVVPEPVVRLCPRCHVAVPATGICDYCD